MVVVVVESFAVELRVLDDEADDVDELPVALKLSLHAAINSAIRSLDTKQVPM